jgi:hypothetical protein
MRQLKAEVRSYPVIEFNPSEVSTFVKRFQRQILLVGLVLGSSSVLLLSGCSSAFTSGLQGPSGAMTASVHGKTHGGQFPVSGSIVYLYEVYSQSSGPQAATGYGTASTQIATADNPTDGGGGWNISSFTCANASDELYVASVGGNPGLVAGTDNTALVLTAALGPCSAVEAGTPSFVYVDEVTTVAMAYSLAGFSTDYKHIGTSPTNTVGLKNAFATFNNLVNVTIGQAYTQTPAYATPPASCTTTPAACTPVDTFRSIVPYDLINTLANVLAGCVNSDGTTNCSNLFAVTGGSLASPAATITNTADAALYIAHHPGLAASSNPGVYNNLSALLALGGISAPFSPNLTSAPTDYTMTVNFVGGGLGGVKATSDDDPGFLAVDGNGNVWIPNTGTGTVTELNNLGVPLSPSTTIKTTVNAKPPVTIGGFPTGAQTPDRVAIDSNGNVWINDQDGCLVGLNSSGTALTGSPFTTPCGGAIPYGLAVDTSNNIWVALNSPAGITSTDNTGAVRTGFPLSSGFIEMSGFLGEDYTGHMWYIDGGFFGGLNTSGTSYIRSTESFSAAAPYAALGPLATSAGGNGGLAMWVPQGVPSGTMQPARITGGSVAVDTFPNPLFPPTLESPTGIAVDGNGNYYFSNVGGGYNGSLYVNPNVTAMTSSGSLVSPPLTGFMGGSALTELNTSVGVAIDQSGNLWALNQSNSNLGGGYLGNGDGAGNITEFVGLATPANPVLAEDATNQTYGIKP